MIDNLIPIGTCKEKNGAFFIEVYPKFRTAMKGLNAFQYLQIIWCFDQCDNEASRNKLSEKQPYKNAPTLLGTFATRSPERPNPIAVSTVYVLSVDTEKGLIEVPYFDAFSGTPLLDIKPYIPSLDRVEHVTMPQWCADWPASVEASGEFDWSEVFDF